MLDIIKHQGIVENIDGSHIRVRIVQSSACAACSVKGHCSSADTKEKVVDVITEQATSYRIGEQVMVVGELSMGMKAVLLAFVIPFLILVISLFILMTLWENELSASLCSLGLLAPYYLILWLNKKQLKRKFAFSIQPLSL